MNQLKKDCSVANIVLFVQFLNLKYILVGLVGSVVRLAISCFTPLGRGFLVLVTSVESFNILPETLSPCPHKIRSNYWNENQDCERE